MHSLWTEDVIMPKFKPLQGDLHTHVLIIGGGMAGILCAYRLQAQGVPYALVEAEELCSGVTKNTTAKITSQHGMIYAAMTRRFGEAYTKRYLEANERALGEYRKLCRHIDCDFEERPSAVYSLDDRKKPEAEIDCLQKIGYPAKYRWELPLPFAIAGAVEFPHQAQFHPLKFAAAISSGLNIYEHTKVLEMTSHAAVTEHGTITADKIIAATHFPFINKHGGYYLKQYQHRSYVIAYENAPDVGGMYVDESNGGLSFRNYRELLLIGGCGARTGKPCGSWQEITDFTKRHYPAAKEKFRWAAQDCMTLDNIPYIGQYARSTPDFFVATGFNKWGMTSSMAAADILADLVQGRENPYAELFSPSRSMLRPQLFVNAFEATVNLLTPTTRRCPHLGCALKWNGTEYSWDCPCHGSRFTESGRLLDNPATADLPEPSGGKRPRRPDKHVRKAGR